MFPMLDRKFGYDIPGVSFNITLFGARAVLMFFRDCIWTEIPGELIALYESVFRQFK